MADHKSELIRVFLTKAEPPASIAAIINSVSALKKTIAAWQPELRRCFATSMPLSPGIEMSSTTTSGMVVLNAATADFPSGAVPTISQCGANISRQSARISGVSSTSRTVGRFRKRLLNYDRMTCCEKVQGEVAREPALLNVDDVNENVQLTVVTRIRYRWKSQRPCARRDKLKAESGEPGRGE